MKLFDPHHMVYVAILWRSVYNYKPIQVRSRGDMKQEKGMKCTVGKFSIFHLIKLYVCRF